jgi:hypothetical protein
MRQTVVGVFDRHDAARRAATQLEDSGFGPDSVHISEEPGVPRSGGALTGTSQPPGTEESGWFAGLRSFLAEVFGSTGPEHQRHFDEYAEAVRRGGAVVKVDVDDESRIDAARSALVAAGAVDIEERAAEWRRGGWGAADAAAAASAGSGAGIAASAGTSTAEAEREVSAAEATPGTGPAAASAGRGAGIAGGAGASTAEAEREVSAAEATRGTGPAAASAGRGAGIAGGAGASTAADEREVSAAEATRGTGGGVRVYPRSTGELHAGGQAEPGAAAQVPGAAGDDVQGEAFRRHFGERYAAAGARYEDYEPHYRHGHALRGEARFQGLAWEEMEPEVRADWERRHPGGEWDAYKEAVRRGWERMPV